MGLRRREVLPGLTFPLSSFIIGHMTTFQVSKKLGIHRSRLYRLISRAGFRPNQNIVNGHVVNTFTPQMFALLRSELLRAIKSST